MTGAPNRKGNAGLQWRYQNAPQEWAMLGDCEDLIEVTQVAGDVQARTGGLCYVYGCPNQIAVYPHAIPMWEEGVHHPINRVGVCLTHAEELRSGRDPSGERRRYLRVWIQDWYREHHGLSRWRWTVMATGQVPITAMPARRAAAD